jgi:hypothetical protein
MGEIEKLEEAMKVLDMLSIFLMEDSEHYINSEEIRSLLEETFEKIRDIYESLNGEENTLM